MDEKEIFEKLNKILQDNDFKERNLIEYIEIDYMDREQIELLNQK